MLAVCAEGDRAISTLHPTGETMSTNSETRITKLILIPAVITLAITLLRLIGELQHWSTSLFNPAAGGGGALIGISWLPPILRIWVARQVVLNQETPASAGKVILFAIPGFILAIGGFLIAFLPQIQFPGKLVVGLLIVIAATAAQFRPW